MFLLFGRIEKFSKWIEDSGEGRVVGVVGFLWLFFFGSVVEYKIFFGERIVFDVLV